MKYMSKRKNKEPRKTEKQEMRPQGGDKLDFGATEEFGRGVREGGARGRAR